MSKINNDYFLPTYRERDRNFKELFLKKLINIFGTLKKKFLRIPNPTVNDIGPKSVEQFKQLLNDEIPLKKSKTSIKAIWIKQKDNIPNGTKFEISGSKALAFDQQELIDYFDKVGLAAFITEFVKSRWNKPTNDIDPRTTLPPTEASKIDSVSLSTLKHLAEIEEITCPIEINRLSQELGIPPIYSAGDFRILKLKGCDAGVGVFIAFCMFSDSNIHVVIKDPSKLTEEMDQVEFTIETDDGESFLQAFASKGLGIVRPIKAGEKDYHSCFNFLYRLSQGEPCHQQEDYIKYLNTFLKHCSHPKYTPEKVAEMLTRMIDNHSKDRQRTLMSILLNFEWSLSLGDPTLAAKFDQQFMKDLWRYVLPDVDLKTDDPILSLKRVHEIPSELIGATLFFGSALTNALPAEGKETNQLHYDTALTRHFNKPMLEVITSFENEQTEELKKVQSGHSHFLEFDLMRWAKTIDTHYASQPDRQKGDIAENLLSLFDTTCEAALLKGLSYPPLEEQHRHLTADEETLLPLLRKFIAADDPLLIKVGTTLALTLAIKGNVEAEALLFEQCLPKLQSSAPELAKHVIEKLLLFFAEKANHDEILEYLEAYSAGDESAWPKALSMSDYLAKYAFSLIPQTKHMDDVDAWNAWLINALEKFPQHTPAFIETINPALLPSDLLEKWLKMANGTETAKQYLLSQSIEPEDVLYRLKDETSFTKVISELRQMDETKLDQETSQRAAEIITRVLPDCITSGSSETLRALMNLCRWEKHVSAEELRKSLSPYFASHEYSTKYHRFQLYWLRIAIGLKVEIPLHFVEGLLAHEIQHPSMDKEEIQDLLKQLQNNPGFKEQHAALLSALAMKWMNHDALEELDISQFPISDAAVNLQENYTIILNKLNQLADKKTAQALMVAIPILRLLYRATMTNQARRQYNELLMSLRTWAKEAHLKPQSQAIGEIRLQLQISAFVQHQHIDFLGSSFVELFKQPNKLDESHLIRLRTVATKAIKKEVLTTDEIYAILSNPTSFQLLGPECWFQGVLHWLEKNSQIEQKKTQVRILIEMYLERSCPQPDSTAVAKHILTTNLLEKIYLIDSIWWKLSNLYKAVDPSIESLFCEAALNSLKVVNSDYLRAQIYNNPSIAANVSTPQSRSKIQQIFRKIAQEDSELALSLIEKYSFLETKENWQLFWNAAIKDIKPNFFQRALIIWQSRISIDNDFDIGALLLDKLHELNLDNYDIFIDKPEFALKCLDTPLLANRPNIRNTLLKTCQRQNKASQFLVFYPDVTTDELSLHFYALQNAPFLHKTILETIQQCLTNNDLSKDDYNVIDQFLDGYDRLFVQPSVDISAAITSVLHSICRHSSRHPGLDIKICSCLLKLAPTKENDRQILNVLKRQSGNHDNSWINDHQERIIYGLNTLLPTITLEELQSLKPLVRILYGQQPNSQELLDFIQKFVQKECILVDSASPPTFYQCCEAIKSYLLYQPSGLLQHALKILMCLPEYPKGSSEFNKFFPSLLPSSIEDIQPLLEQCLKSEINCYLNAACELIKRVLDFSPEWLEQASWRLLLHKCYPINDAQSFYIYLKKKGLFKQSLILWDVYLNWPRLGHTLSTEERMNRMLELIDNILVYNPYALERAIPFCISFYTLTGKQAVHNNTIYSTFVPKIYSRLLMAIKDKDFLTIQSLCRIMKPLFTAVKEIKFDPSKQVIDDIYFSYIRELYLITKNKELVSRVCDNDRVEDPARFESIIASNALQGETDFSWCIANIIFGSTSENEAILFQFEKINTAFLGFETRQVEFAYVLCAYSTLISLLKNTTIDSNVRKEHYDHLVLLTKLHAQKLEKSNHYECYCQLLTHCLPHLSDILVLSEKKLDACIENLKKIQNTSPRVAENLFKVLCLQHYFIRSTYSLDYPFLLEMTMNICTAETGKGYTLLTTQEKPTEAILNTFVEMYLLSIIKRNAIVESRWIIGLFPALGIEYGAKCLSTCLAAGLQQEQPIYCFRILEIWLYQNGMTEHLWKCLKKTAALLFQKRHLQEAEQSRIERNFRLLASFSKPQYRNTLVNYLWIMAESLRRKSSKHVTRISPETFNNVILEIHKHIRDCESSEHQELDKKVENFYHCIDPNAEIARDCSIQMAQCLAASYPLLAKKWLNRFTQAFEKCNEATMSIHVTSFTNRLVEKCNYALLAHTPASLYLPRDSEDLLTFSKHFDSVSDDTLIILGKCIELLPEPCEATTTYHEIAKRYFKTIDDAGKSQLALCCLASKPPSLNSLAYIVIKDLIRRKSLKSSSKDILQLLLMKAPAEFSFRDKWKIVLDYVLLKKHHGELQHHALHIPLLAALYKAPTIEDFKFNLETISREQFLHATALSGEDCCTDFSFPVIETLVKFYYQGGKVNIPELLDQIIKLHPPIKLVKSPPSKDEIYKEIEEFALDATKYHIPTAVVLYFLKELNEKASFVNRNRLEVAELTLELIIHLIKKYKPTVSHLICISSLDLDIVAQDMKVYGLYGKMLTKQLKAHNLQSSWNNKAKLVFETWVGIGDNFLKTHSKEKDREYKKIIDELLKIFLHYNKWEQLRFAIFLVHFANQGKMLKSEEVLGYAKQIFNSYQSKYKSAFKAFPLSHFWPFMITINNDAFIQEVAKWSIGLLDNLPELNTDEKEGLHEAIERFTKQLPLLKSRPPEIEEMFARCNHWVEETLHTLESHRSELLVTKLVNVIKTLENSG